MEALEGADWLSPTCSEPFALQKQVCKLRNTLYCLKQAPRLWYQDIDLVLHSQAMLQSNSDTNLYYSLTSKLLILLYVDDILLTAPSYSVSKKMKNELKRQYRMSDLGPVKWYLGIEIERCESYTAIHQQSFICDLLNKQGMEYCKGVSTPLEKKTCLYRSLYPDTSDEVSLSNHSINALMSTTAYKSLVGSFQWLMIATRSDLAYLSSTLGQFNSQPTAESIQAGKRVLRYLQSTKDYARHFPTKESYIQHKRSHQDPTNKSAAPIIKWPIGYTDSDWAGDKADRKSTYGSVFMLFSTAVSWKSQKS